MCIQHDGWWLVCDNTRRQNPYWNVQYVSGRCFWLRIESSEYRSIFEVQRKPPTTNHRQSTALYMISATRMMLKIFNQRIKCIESNSILHFHDDIYSFDRSIAHIWVERRLIVPCLFAIVVLMVRSTTVSTSNCWWTSTILFRRSTIYHRKDINYIPGSPPFNVRSRLQYIINA